MGLNCKRCNIPKREVQFWKAQEQCSVLTYEKKNFPIEGQYCVLCLTTGILVDHLYLIHIKVTGTLLKRDHFSSGHDLPQSDQ